MKILFVGVGTSHYYNQVLNKLNEQNNLEIFDLIVSSGVGHVGESVYQTKQGIKFNIVELKEVIFNKYSNDRYKGFKDLPELLEKIKPEIIVVTETYIKMFLYNPDLLSTIKKLNIKIILKDIPFRLDKYNEAYEKIISGSNNSYTPFIVTAIIKLCNKFNIKKILVLGSKIVNYTGLNDWYFKNIGQKNLLKKLQEKKKILNFVDAHVDYVEEAFEIFESYGVPKEKIFIIYNSPDTDLLFKIRKEAEKEAPILEHCEHRLIHVGRLIEWKRIDMLIKSFSKIKSEFSDAELLIIGYGPLEKHLKKLAEELNMKSSIKFIGGIYESKILGQYLLSSTVYVLAGMGGISINDAMTWGKPIICSICDGTEKKLVYNERNGLYFKDGSEEDLTNCIRKLFKNPELVERMGENSTEIIKNEINIHTVIDGYKKAFDYVLRK